MTDLFHRAAEQLAPLTARLVLLVHRSDIVRADETSQKVMDVAECRTGFIWTFIGRMPEPPITYVEGPAHRPCRLIRLPLSDSPFRFRIRTGAQSDNPAPTASATASTATPWAPAFKQPLLSATPADSTR